jgi:hypothetical protein
VRADLNIVSATSAGQPPFPSPSLRQHVTRLLSAKPALFIPAYRLFGKKRQLLVGQDTEIVIEGYPRSANSFAVVAFEMAQQRPVRIAHHLHAAAQVLAAARRQLPCIVLVRNPFDAIASLLVRERGLQPARAIADYVTFYGAVEPVRDCCVVAAFERVTTRYDAVMRDVNAKYGTAFREFVNDEPGVRAVFAEVERLETLRGGEGPDEDRVARPSPRRAEALERVRGQLASGAAGRAMARAVAAYERYAGN